MTGPADDSKRSLLQQQGTLHPRPEAVTDPLFAANSFFDPHDLVQVKYEMIRHVQLDQAPVSQAAEQAGLSRPSFYQAQSCFQQQGLQGLLPRKPGPRGAHKLTPPVLEFVDASLASHPNLKFSELARMIQDKFGTAVHPRTIDRVLSSRQKKRH